jgi:hypothetical protein
MKLQWITMYCRKCCSHSTSWHTYHVWVVGYIKGTGKGVSLMVWCSYWLSHKLSQHICIRNVCKCTETQKHVDHFWGTELGTPYLRITFILFYIRLIEGTNSYFKCNISLFPVPILIQLKMDNYFYISPEFVLFAIMKEENWWSKQIVNAQGNLVEECQVSISKVPV